MGQQEWRQGTENVLHDRARRTLESLQATWNGYEVLEWRDKRPYRVAICPMDTRTVWVRTTIGKGAKTLYELEETKR